MSIQYPKISTITTAELIPEATKAVQKFVKGSSTSRTLPYFGSHITLDDLVMDAVEKVIKANPMYLTKSYVWIAAKCVCIDKLQQKKLPWVSADRVNPTLFDEETTAKSSLEELLEGDAYDEMETMDGYLRACISEDQIKLYDALLSGKMYIEIAENLGISLRTLERQVQELKWTFEFLLTEEDPDTKVTSLLFNS